MKLGIFITSLTFVLIGCGGIPKESLTIVDSGKVQLVTLKDDYVMTVKVPVGTNTLTISKGEYRAFGQNSEGIFYVGPKDCLFWEGSSENGFIQQCGLFVPHTQSSEINLFYFETGEEEISGPFAISAELLRNQSKNFHIYTRQAIAVKKLNQNGL